MDKKVVIGIVVALAVIFFVIPVGVRIVKGAPEANKVAIPNLPPELDTISLTNSIWEIEPKRGIKVQVTLKPNGEAMAWTGNVIIKSMAGTDMLSGKWSVEGATLHVSTNFKGKTYNTDLVIAGKGLYAKEGMPITRIR